MDQEQEQDQKRPLKKIKASSISNIIDIPCHAAVLCCRSLYFRGLLGVHTQKQRIKWRRLSLPKTEQCKISACF
jgi:hypothetical protein